MRNDISSFPADAWLERRYYGGDLSQLAERALHEAGRDWCDEASAEHHIRQALALAPEHLAVQIGAYKFFLYRHRLAEALPHAEICLAELLRRSGLPADWRDLTPGHAAFDSLDEAPRAVLFALVACGYVLARLGREDESRAVLGKVAELDAADRMGARRLLAVIERAGNDDAT